ncbi:MAG: phenylacetic acid degradation protein PaaY [Alphaproteobacteria bacterium]|nr:phenylacetic acid degradation protein PaaY [Alphaproteobacteria bacterium]
MSKPRRPRVYAIDGLVPVVDPTSFVHPTAVLIGDVIVGPGCYIGAGATMRGDFGRLVMEKGSNLQDSCVVHGFPDTDTVLEVDAHIGHGAILHGCTIKRDALVGMNATVMDGAVVGESAFVAAMAFVRAGFVVPPRTLVGGIPAKIMRELTDREIEWKRSGTRDYQNLTLRCLATFEECDALEAPEPGRQRLSLKGVSEPLYKTKGG